MSNHTADLLRKAKDRIGTPEKWAKEHFFSAFSGYDLRDFETFPDDCPACALGASAWATGSKGVTTVDEALTASLPNGFDYVDDFNDHPDTTHADIMALFDRAITAEESTS
jgi:hypothetical protein